MKKLLIIAILASLSNICFSQLITTKSNFDFSTTLIADSTGFILNNNAVTFINKGDQSVLIDANFEIGTDEFISLGGNDHKLVRDTIDITFTGVGTKKLFIIRETVSPN